MNFYRTSDGSRVSKSTIDRKTSQAKKQKLADQLDEYGHNFCMECLRNDCLPITVAHLLSVDRCQKEGRSELAWNPENLQILGMPCHKKYDKLNLQFNG